MNKDEALEAKIEAQLREWAAELESLKAKADRAVAEARKGYYEQVDELREEIEAKLTWWSKTLEPRRQRSRASRRPRTRLSRDFTTRSRLSFETSVPSSGICAIERRRPRRRRSVSLGSGRRSGSLPGLHSTN